MSWPYVLLFPPLSFRPVLSPASLLPPIEGGRVYVIFTTPFCHSALGAFLAEDTFFPLWPHVYLRYPLFRPCGVFVLFRVHGRFCSSCDVFFLFSQRAPPAPFHVPDFFLSLPFLTPHNAKSTARITFSTFFLYPCWPVFFFLQGEHSPRFLFSTLLIRTVWRCRAHSYVLNCIDSHHLALFVGFESQQTLSFLQAPPPPFASHPSVRASPLVPIIFFGTSCASLNYFPSEAAFRGRS